MKIRINGKKKKGRIKGAGGGGGVGMINKGGVKGVEEKKIV